MSKQNASSMRVQMSNFPVVVLSDQLTIRGLVTAEELETAVMNHSVRRLNLKDATLAAGRVRGVERVTEFGIGVETSTSAPRIHEKGPR